MSLAQVVYYSAATQEWSTDELKRILDSSVRHNEASGLTGMLLYMGGSFMQVLEGEEAAIDETMSRIQRDPRHFDIYIVMRQRIQAREFSNWHMGFRHISLEEQKALPHFMPYFNRGFDIARISQNPGIAVELLRHFGMGG